MTRILFLIGVLVAVTSAHAQQKKFRAEAMFSYTVGNNLNLGLTSKSIYPMVIGVNAAYDLSKKKYSPLRIHLATGIRYSRSGYRMEGYLDTRPEFYKENGISTWADGTESKLVQSYINVPFGIEFRYNTNPVKFRKVNEFALRLLVNNAFLISTELDESVYSYLIDDNIAKQTADLKPYLASHYPGMTIDLTICTYLNFGVTWHKMSFEKAEPDLNFDGRSASPFYEMITDDGSYTDLSMYLGISIPLTQSQEIG